MLSPQQQDAEFQRKFEKTNRLLLELGWMQVQQMPNYQVDAVEKLLDLYEASKPMGNVDRPLNEVNEIMLEHIFSPLVRAFTLFRMSLQPSTRAVAHHVEAATHHYYNKDFFSCVLSMLPALEGMLVARMGWLAGSGIRRPPFREVIESLSAATTTMPFFQSRFELHRDALTAFMKRWIFASHTDIDTSVSYLNRHYALHCMGNGCYYTAPDCHRLFTFIDVYIDFLAYENGIGAYALIPDQEPFINARVNHYVSIILGDEPLSTIRERGASLMAAHPGFTIEMNPPDHEKIAATGERLRNEMMQRVLGGLPTQ
ncbi:MAG: hypothetical protein KGO02_16215 [Alphaproteobacteria bacterium]|nr:hypothetical protein [Alphaproteobacteria bacterium]